ncbi:MAG: vWA domain-containing protein [Myxococcota bacterium]
MIGLLILSSAASAGAGADPDPLGRFYRGYRSELLEPVAGHRPDRIRILPPAGPGRWPTVARESLERRVLAEWPLDRTYGPLQTSVGVWLTHPMVTGTVGSELLVPVVTEGAASLKGVVDLPRPPGPRRIVILLDASSSANAATLYGTSGGLTRRVSILEAERSALRHLLGRLPGTEVEIGVIAYGETTWPIAPPGTPPSEIGRRLAEWERSTPRGVGRTDLVCALEVARDWLRETPEPLEREVLLLTDGDLPHSGRFIDCSFARRRGGKAAEAACEARRNRSRCPASHRFRRTHGSSDLVQLTRFGGRARTEFRVYPLVFDSTRTARPYRELAKTTGGELFRVPSADALADALPGLISRRIRAVRAFNETLGVGTADLLDSSTGRFEGSLPLAPGANDVLLRVETPSATAALYRFRIYHEPDHLRRLLVELQDENHSLEERLERGRRQRPLRKPPVRSVVVVPEHDSDRSLAPVQAHVTIPE